MPSLNLRNALKRDPNRPTLKQRAAALKATAGRVLKRRPVEVTPAVTSANPRLVAMIADMMETRRKLNDSSVPDGPAADALSEREIDLTMGIHRFPAQSIHDMRAKLPLLREEAEDAARGWDGRRVPFGESLPGAAWAGLLRDIEHLAGAPASVVGGNPDAALLALAPALLPKLDEHDRLKSIFEDLFAKAHSAFGGERSYASMAPAAWKKHRAELEASPGWAAYIEARKPLDALDNEIEALVAPHMDVPAQTLDGLLLKARIGRSFEHYEDNAANDLDLLLATNLTTGDLMRTAEAVATRHEPDPIFAVIEASRKAQAAMKEWAAEARAAGKQVTPDFAEEDRLNEAQYEAQEAVIATVPTTPAGRLALLEYLRWQMRLHGMTDGEPPEASSPFWRDAYKALKAALAFEGESAPAAPQKNEAAAPRNLSKEAFDYAYALDLSNVSFKNLWRLYEVFLAAYDLLWPAANESIFDEGTAKPCCEHTSGGLILDAEANRLGCLRDAVANELRRRTPRNEAERCSRLEVLVGHEIRCEGRIRDKALLAELNAAWGA